MPFKVNYISLELLRDHQLVWNLVRGTCLPAFESFRGGILAHDFHNIGRCDRPGIWVSFKKSARPKPMVSMAVRNVDGCQIPALCCNPLRQSIGRLDRHKG